MSDEPDQPNEPDQPDQPDDDTPSGEGQDPAREAQNVRTTGTTTPGGGVSITRETGTPQP